MLQSRHYYKHHNEHHYELVLQVQEEWPDARQEGMCHNSGLLLNQRQ